MIEHLKKIISSDLIINDKVYNVDNSLKFPWQWIANIELFFNDTATTEIYTRSIVGSVRCV